MAASDIFIQRHPPECIALRYVYFCIYLLFSGVLARALPTSLGSPFGPMTSPVAALPTSIPKISEEVEAAWRKSMHWFKCVTGPPQNEMIGLGCTLLGYNAPLPGKNSPVMKRSINMLGADSSLKHVTLDHKVESPSWGIDLYPCWFEDTGRLLCDTTSQPLTEFSKYPGLQDLLTGLIDGLPISVGPQLGFPPDFSPEVYRHVSVYPTGDDYHILLTDSPHQPRPLELFISSPETIEFSFEGSLPVAQSSADPHPHSSPVIYPRASTDNPPAFYSPSPYPDTRIVCVQCGPQPPGFSETGIDPSTGCCMPFPPSEINTDSSFREHPPLKHVYQQVQGVFGHATLVFCWFQSNELTSSAELHCALAELIASLTVSDFIGIDSDSDSDFDSDGHKPNIGDTINMDPSAQDQSSSVPEEQHSANLTKKASEANEHRANNKHFRRQLVPETFVDRWFLCWTGSGSKMLCEIPDWYTEDEHHPQSKYVRSFLRKTYVGGVHSSAPQPSPPEAHVPLHFLVDPAPLWHHCKFNFTRGLHGLSCVKQINDRATVRSNRSHKPGPINKDVDWKSSDSVGYSREKRDKTTSDQPAQNMTFSAVVNKRNSAFGRMGETFAFIGFFTVLTVFTIVLSWLTKHLFLAIYDSLEEWTENRRRRRKLAPAKDFGIDDSFGGRAPSYFSTDRGFQGPVHTVTFPQVAVMNEEPLAAASTTGSQPAEASSDSVKRKKAAMRATVAEEGES